ncbi:MAG: hypothetical protein ACR2QC_07015 [Gammaproteobacteria bacterium]
MPSPDNQLIVTENSALATLTRTEADTQLEIARAYPRDIAVFQTKAMAMACLNKDIAASMFYALPPRKTKDGEEKIIEGPSVRLSEVVGATYTNMKVGARIIAFEERVVVAQGIGIDLETNYNVSLEVRRRIVGKNGWRYNDDMINMTANAAMSIARRNVTFAVVPSALVSPIYERAKQLSVGDLSEIEKTREDCLAYFRNAGATDEQILSCLGLSHRDDLMPDHLVILRGLATAIKDGDTSLETVLTKQREATRSKLDKAIANLGDFEPDVEPGNTEGQEVSPKPSETPMKRAKKKTKENGGDVESGGSPQQQTLT